MMLQFMKKNLLYVLIALNISMLTSCTNNQNNSLIIGKWQGAEWLVNGKPSAHNAKATIFTFNQKNEYSFDYAGTIEKGTYKVENTMLFTTAENKQEIMVNITTLTSDSLVFNMNSGGEQETLILLRKK